MHAPHPPIPLYLGDVDIAVIQSVLDNKFPDQPLSLEEKKVKKEGRSLEDFINFLYSDPVGTSLIAGAMIEIFKATFREMWNLASNRKKPSARVRLKNGDTLVFFEDMSEKEIIEKLSPYIEAGEIEYVIFR